MGKVVNPSLLKCTSDRTKAVKNKHKDKKEKTKTTHVHNTEYSEKADVGKAVGVEVDKEIKAAEETKAETKTEIAVSSRSFHMRVPSLTDLEDAPETVYDKKDEPKKEPTPKLSKECSEKKVAAETKPVTTKDTAAQKSSFDKKTVSVDKPAAGTKSTSSAKSGEKATKKTKTLKISAKMLYAIKNASDELLAMGRNEASNEIKTIYSKGTRSRFSVAVVGEFSRGKSSLVNSLLERDVLPVGDLPTTALLTRIRHNTSEKMVHFDAKNRKLASMPVSQESWEGLTADIFGKCDPEGTMVIGLNSPWLQEYSIELADTPGAGDLEEKRARVIGDALMGSDGAIIAVDATCALSQSEMLFIRQRLLSRKTPFLMIALTKLDLIRENERSAVIEFVKNKLASEGMDIPVFITQKVPTTKGDYSDIMGLDKIRERISEWIYAPERVSVTEKWVAGQAQDVLLREISAVSQELELLSMDDNKRLDTIREKKAGLAKAAETWENLRLEMLECRNACYDKFIAKTEEYASNIAERLKYEVSHTGTPEKWWKEDYPYRLKVELANMATGLDNTISRIIAEDTNRFNNALDKNFKTHVISRRDVIADKVAATSVVGGKTEIGFENIDKQKNISRISTAALSIAGFALFSSLGFIPIVATMGVSTGSSIITEKLFRGKIEKQRDDIKAAITREIPNIIAEAVSDSEMRLKAVYDDIIKSAHEKEISWVQSQEAAIENSNKPQNKAHTEALTLQLDRLRSLSATIDMV